MQELEEGARAFSTFRVLNSVSEHAERDQLFRNMAQLFSYVSDRCDDEQVAQYDEVLCQLADLVEVEARAHVATVLAGLERAPGTVIMRLANDVIEVARPLLEFSSVLSDDDLIEIVTNKSDAHRAAIASRADVPERVGEAIIEHGDTSSVLRLVHNPRAELGSEAIEKLAIRASDDDVLAADLRGRAGIDWRNLRSAIDSVAGRVLGSLGKVHPDLDPEVAGRVNELVYNRLHNKAGFSASSWKLAYNQVKALSDRRGLDRQALARFARFFLWPPRRGGADGDAADRAGRVRQMAGLTGLCGHHRGVTGVGARPGAVFGRGRGSALARHSQRVGHPIPEGPFRSHERGGSERDFFALARPFVPAASGARERWRRLISARRLPSRLHWTLADLGYKDIFMSVGGVGWPISDL